MMRTDSLKNQSHWYEVNLKMDRRTIITVIIGFFLARANLLNKLTPFGFAFLTAYIIMKSLNVPMLLSIVIGTLTFQGTKGISYVLSYLLIYGFFSLFKEEKTYSLIKASLVSSIIFTSCRVAGVFLSKQLFIYDLFMVLFEGVIVFTMIYIFSFSLPIEKIGGANFNNEKAICSFITLALALAGVKDILILGFGIKNVISIMLVLYVSYSYGAFIGGTSGIILGMVGYISQPEMPFIIGILGISGLLAGIFKDVGKSCSALGFIIGNGITSFYVNGLGTSFLGVKEIIIGVILFLISANKINERFTESFVFDLDMKKDYNQKRDDIIIKKLNRMTEVFNNLSETFKESANERDFHSTGEVYSMVDSIANSICTSCAKYQECWEKNYYTTYQNFFNLVGIVEMKTTDGEFAYEEAKKFCIRSEKTLDLIDRAVEKLNIDHNWKLKLRENRLLLAEQLEEIGKVIENMTEDIYVDPKFNEEIEQNLYKDLKNNRLDIKDVSVVQIGEEDFEIFIDLNTAIKTEGKLKAMITQSLGQEVISDTNFNSISNKTQRFKLLRTNRFSAMTKVATMPNSENKISGDSFTFGEIENTHFSALSDGMGIGRKANEESKVAISLLERLMEANAGKDMILKTINSVLRVKSNEEMFTTLDLAFIDLYAGKLQMIKTGAPATFIKKKDRVDMISDGTLPVGILKDIDFNLYEEYIEDGDIIIMMSDGVLDVNRDIYNAEDWMKNIIINIDSINPQVIANEILNRVQEVASTNTDDMTVLVTKVWKNV
jgi:stage II sporulation protein E